MTEKYVCLSAYSEHNCKLIKLGLEKPGPVYIKYYIGYVNLCEPAAANKRTKTLFVGTNTKHACCNMMQHSVNYDSTHGHPRKERIICDRKQWLFCLLLFDRRWRSAYRTRSIDENYILVWFLMRNDCCCNILCNRHEGMPNIASIKAMMSFNYCWSFIIHSSIHFAGA